MKTYSTIIALIGLIAAAAIAGYLLWPAEKKEKFVVYRPDPSKDAWARDTVLTQVLSSGKLA
jgi:Flp pilus assembly protein CpaB